MTGERFRMGAAFLLLLAVLMALAPGCGAEPTPTPRPTATAVPTPTPRPTATAVPTPTPRPTATAVPTPTPRPTATAVPMKTVSFKVSASDEYSVNLHMSAGSRLEFRFTSDLDINVQLLGPLRGAPLGSYSRVAQLSEEYVAKDAGTHSLVFDNSFSLLASKLVRLTYRVVPPGGR